MTTQALTRRTFLGTSALALSPLVLPATVLGREGIAPNSKITLGAIGINRRGGYVLQQMLAWPDVQCLAVCDIRADRRTAIKEQIGCATYRDFRDLLDCQDIDTVLIATGDHWHAHASIYAAQAGKDVYCESPCGITIDLCQKLAETTRKCNTVFQGGTQRRSVKNFQFAAGLARDGKLGNIHTVHASISPLRCRYDWYSPQPLPDREEIDWDLWLGPVPWRPYNRAYVLGNWRGHFDFDAGISKLATHTVDLCQWALDTDGDAPIRYGTEGNSCYATYRNGAKLVMRPDGWLGLGTCSVRFEGDEGWVETGDSGRIVVSSGSLRSEVRTLGDIPRGTDPTAHIRNFFDCVRTRQQPVCNAEVVASSHFVCHASVLSWMLQRELTYVPVNAEFADVEANGMRIREWREPWSV